MLKHEIMASSGEKMPSLLKTINVHLKMLIVKNADEQSKRKN